MKCLIMSLIEKSHKSYVSDLRFIPGIVKVDKKNDNLGKSEHFITASEDGYFCIWDSRHVRREELVAIEGAGKQVKPWQPFKMI